MANELNSSETIFSLQKEIKELKKELEEEKKAIKNKLYIDELTKLRNRQALLDDSIEEDFISIALVDIDAFDNINELYGFSIGNEVLIEVAKILKDFAIKNHASLYKIYGNVYAIVNIHVVDFIKYYQMIVDLTKLFKDLPIKIKGIELDIFIDITLGISIAQEEPLRAAGMALKNAKKKKLPFSVYNTELDTKDLIKKTMKWRGKINDSLNDNKVVPFFQPIFDYKKNIVKYETLMRIAEEDENGNISYLLPSEFLEVSVKTKQYLELSKKVIKKALDTLKTTDKQISINLGFNDILNQDFRMFLEQNITILEEDVRSRLVFEILESDHITNYDELEEFILEYRRLNIQIAIDDFGTGYSNFEHLLKVRPDYLKIDGSLIKNICTDKNSLEMVKSIISFSKALNIKLIAEYIHSEEVFEMVKLLGIDEFQGYFLGEPSINIHKF